MWQIVKEHPRAFIYALAAHLVLVGMLVFSLDWTPKMTAGDAKPEPVQAIVVDESKVSAELERIQDAERRKQEQERAAAERLRQLEQQTREAEAARVKEQQRLEEVRQQQAQEQRRLEEQEAKRKIEQEKLAAEAKRLEEMKRKQAEAERQQAEQKRLAEAEAKRKMEAEAKRKAEAEARRKAEAEAKAKAEAEAKRRAEAEAQRKAAEQALQAQIEGERTQALVDRYGSAIKAQVERNWIRPPNWLGLSCNVQVRLLPSGDVVSVQIVKSSGDAAFDRSVEAAVYRAAPLPLPPDPALFERFRTVEFVFTPR